MRKRVLPALLALAMCLGLTVPAFAAKAGDTVVKDEAGEVYTFSKPIVGTEQIKFNYTLEGEEWPASEKDRDYCILDGMLYDKNLAQKAKQTVTVLMIPVGTLLTFSGEYGGRVIKESGEHTPAHIRQALLQRNNSQRAAASKVYIPAAAFFLFKSAQILSLL